MKTTISVIKTSDSHPHAGRQVHGEAIIVSALATALSSIPARDTEVSLPISASNEHQVNGYAMKPSIPREHHHHPHRQSGERMPRSRRFIRWRLCSDVQGDPPKRAYTLASTPAHSRTRMGSSGLAALSVL